MGRYFTERPLSLQDLLDSDALLDEDDLKKPDAASLKAPTCGEGAGKKKKACKNWSVDNTKSIVLSPVL